MKPVDRHDEHWLEAESDLPVLRLVRAPWVLRSLAAVLVALLALGIASLVVVPWQQTVVGHGRVVAASPRERQQTVEAPVDGRVLRVHVREGQQVDEGELLISLSDVDPLFVQRLETEREMAVLRQSAAQGRVTTIGERIASLAQAREVALQAADARVAMARERAAQAGHAVDAAQAASDAAAQNLPRIRSLAAQGLRSSRDRELAELDVARAEAELARGRASLTAARSEVDSLVAERARLEQDTLASMNDARASQESARAELASSSAEVARIDTRRARQEEQEVRAPRAGSVFRVHQAQEGQMVKAGDTLLQLVPTTTERVVEVWVDGNDAPLVTPGRVARVQIEGWPAIQFVGWPSVARGTFGGRVLLVDAHDDGSGRFRVLIEPDAADPWPSSSVLRQGARANAWILLDQVALGFELWRQVNGFPPVVTPPPHDKGDDKAMDKADKKGGKT